MSKVGLLIVYNHRYDKNIPRLEEIYRGRFSHLFHIVPFYDGKQENVIPVYESSYCFSGYISQTYTHLKDKGFTHFFVVADDMIINPNLNENNLWQQMGIDIDDCYMDGLIVLQERKTFWSHLLQAMDYVVAKEGVEINNILPSKKKQRNVLTGITYLIPQYPRIFLGVDIAAKRMENAKKNLALYEEETP